MVAGFFLAPRNCSDDHYFRCETGKCILKTSMCDDNYDCGAFDYSDEKDCGSKF